MIISCIQRHFERECRGHDLPRVIATLDDLSRSEAVREPFHCLCGLAYHGVMENKVTSLPQGSNTLSLLQAVESFLQSGELSQFQQLFNQPRFAAVFLFYSAITKLKSPGICQVIDRIVEEKTRPLLVSLLHCLFEAQDPSLCLYVAKRLEKLDLSGISLSPLDCMSVSFFLSSAVGNEIRLNIDLQQCSISDVGAKCLAKYLCSDVDHMHVGEVIINLCANEIHEINTSYVATLLCFTDHIYLSHNLI